MAGLRCSVFAVLLLCCLSSAVARRLHQASVKFPAVQLGHGPRILHKSHLSAKGGAVAALGRPALAELKRKAHFSGTVQELAHHIDSDDDLSVDAVNKALLYICQGLTASDAQQASAAAAAAGEIASGVAPTAADATVTPAQAFSLSSRPTATKKIFLDFDGHVTTGSDWNNAKQLAAINTPAYDKDGNPSNWSADELADIVAIWRAVSEDYAMFDVDVTTADPGEAALGSGNGVRMAIGGCYSDWWGSAAGGVSYVGRFGTPNLPSFVFPLNLGPNNAKFVWEAVSHEAGHALGLTHDGTTAGAAYYSGQGDWAPIMGSGYYKSITTFDKGEYTGSNNQQDDLAVIGTFLPQLPQQNGISLATATPLIGAFDSSSGLMTAKAQGVVSTAAGDWFSFSAAAGAATLSSAVLAGGRGGNRANLNTQITVYSADGSVLASLNPTGADPTTGLSVPAQSITLPAAGTYYVAVTGAGEGDVTQTGYSSYASRVQFELTVVYPAVVAVPSPSPAVIPDASPSVSNTTTGTNTTAPDVNATGPQPPSPSPSPVPSPSPSPSPVSSPSPKPLPAMKVASIGMTRVWANTARTQVFCTVSITVRDAANVLAGVKTNAQWRLAPSVGSPLTAFTANVLTSASGTASFRSGNMAADAGGSCTFSVLDASLAGYQFDTTQSVMTRSE